MTYNKVHPSGWHDAPDGTTPITADALDTIEQGISDTSTAVDGVVTQLSTFVPALGPDGNYYITSGS